MASGDYDHFADAGRMVFLYAGGDTVTKNGCDYYHAIESTDKLDNIFVYRSSLYMVYHMRHTNPYCPNYGS